MLQELQGIPILPQHVWEQYATGDGKGLRQFPNLPVGDQPLVGGGPFVLSKYEKDSVAIFSANPNFYGPKPSIDGFGLQYFSNDDAMISNLRNGQIQAAINIPPTAMKTLQGDPSLTVYDGPGLQFRDFIINSSPNKTTNLELLDPKVRMAMEYAVDRDAIVQTAWLGFAKPGSTILPPAAGIWHDPSVKPLPYDIAKANAILDAAGYPKGPDGIRTANGHEMDYTVLFAKDESGAGDTAFQIIQNGFQQIGIKITQRKEDNDAVNTAILGDDATYNTFDLAMWDWYPCCPVPDFILSVVECSQFGNWSDTGYCNPAYDKMYTAQGLQRTLSKRVAMVHAMQKLIYDARPYIVLSNDDTLNAWSTDWTGFVEGSARPVQQPVEGEPHPGAPGVSRPGAEGPGASRRLRHQAGVLRPDDGVRRDHDQLPVVPRPAGRRRRELRAGSARLAAAEGDADARLRPRSAAGHAVRPLPEAADLPRQHGHLVRGQPAGDR